MKRLIPIIILFLCSCQQSEITRRLAETRTVPAKFDLKYQKLIFDLAERINFASLYSGPPSSKNFGETGLFIDFGTTDYFKYALGGWNTGWGESGKEQNVTFTKTRGNVSEIFFPASNQGDVVLKIRMRPEKSKSVSVYVNNHPLAKIDFTQDWWEVYSVKIGKQMFARGENRLLFKWGGSGLKNKTAASVDYVHFAESDSEEDEILLPKEGSEANLYYSPKQDLVKGKINLNGKEIGALILHSGFAVTYYIQIPEEKFRPKFAAYLKIENAGKSEKFSPCDFTVGVKADDGTERLLLGGEIRPEKFKEFRLKVADLADFSGKAVELGVEFHCSGGQSKLLMAGAGIYINADKYPKIGNRETAKNVIFIMIDTQRADQMGAYGNSAVKTPEFDRFAKQGVLFERFSSAEDWTKPSVATMLTGAYPSTHKAQTEKVILSDELKLLPQILRDKGIKTGAFVANDYVTEKFGFNRGWDYYINYITEGKMSEAPYVFGGALAWIKENKNQKFFAYIHTIDVHSPYNPPKHFLNLYDAKPYSGPIIPAFTYAQVEDIKIGKLWINYRDLERLRALYAGEITYHDKYLGKFVRSLESLGILENTLVIITADHGEEFDDHGSFGHGHSLYQELTHVPFAMVWKNMVPKGKKIATNFDHAILAPTVTDAFGFDAPAQFEGNSLFESDAYVYPAAGFSAHKDYKMSVWSNNLKFLVHNAYGKFSFFIYDTNRDPQCLNNIYKKNLILLRYMQTLLGNFLGASDKRDWRSSEMLPKRGVEIEIKEVQWDDELKKQLGVAD